MQKPILTKKLQVNFTIDNKENCKSHTELSKGF